MIINEICECEKMNPEPFKNKICTKCGRKTDCICDCHKVCIDCMADSELEYL